MLKTNKSANILFQGTPLQNSLLELFALLHFIDPIEFPDLESESKSFRGLQEDKISQIHDLLKPRSVPLFPTYPLKYSNQCYTLLFVSIFRFLAVTLVFLDSQCRLS